jgi:ectoine hydroxylase-related dioxygenase (phytanoyl-CoA dioxygenase family)
MEALRQYDDASLDSMAELFHRDGFVVFHRAIEPQVVSTLRTRLDEVLDGRYSRGSPPDKMPPPRSSSGSTTASGGGGDSSRVLQVVNVHKCDVDFRALATSPAVGRIVSRLARWANGARLAQDQVWHKPPGSPPLAFHRDSPYFMFLPGDVVTVWVALDDMDDEVGPLEYVRGSHLWGDGRHGSCRTFFGANNRDLLHSAARREGIADPENALEIASMSGLRAGGMSVHHGRTWHGSGRNASGMRPRRGYGMHYVPVEVRFTADARFSSLWKKYVPPNDDDGGAAGDGGIFANVELPEEDFPLAYAPDDAGG